MSIVLNESSKCHELNESSKCHELNESSKCHELNEASKYHELNEAPYKYNVYMQYVCNVYVCIIYICSVLQCKCVWNILVLQCMYIHNAFTGNVCHRVEGEHLGEGGKETAREKDMK